MEGIKWARFVWIASTKLRILRISVISAAQRWMSRPAHPTHRLNRSLLRRQSRFVRRAAKPCQSTQNSAACGENHLRWSRTWSDQSACARADFATQQRDQRSLCRRCFRQKSNRGTVEPCSRAAAGAKNNGIVQRSDLTGFNFAEVPTILIEMGFLSNPDEDARMETEEYRDKLAQGICNGIIDYFASVSDNQWSQIFFKKLHNPRFEHSPLPADLHGREFFVCDHLADLLARSFKQGCWTFRKLYLLHWFCSGRILYLTRSVEIEADLSFHRKNMIYNNNNNLHLFLKFVCHTQYYMI